MSRIRRRFNQMLRRQQLSSAGPVRIDSRHIYILPTRYGWLFGLLLVLMLLASLNYDNNPAYLLTFLLFGMGINGMFFTWRNLYGLELQLCPGAPAFAGDPAPLGLQVWSGTRPAIALAIGDGLFLDDLPETARPATPAQVGLTLPTQTRGWLKAGDLEVSTHYPLGLFRAWSILEISEGILVYPRPAPAEGIPATAFRNQADPFSDREGSEEFYGLRDFRSGDPLSHVDWKGLARERGLMTKQFQDPAREQPLIIDWRSFSPRDTETRLSMMTRLVIEAEQAGRPYGLFLPGNTVSAGLGPRHFNYCLRTLALFGVADT